MSGPSDTCIDLSACRAASALPLGGTPARFMCSACGNLLPRSSKRVPKAERLVGRPRRRAAHTVPVAPRARLAPVVYEPTATTPLLASTSQIAAESHSCETCTRGRIGVARWASGVRSCTDCRPLELAAIGVNKSIPVIALAERVQPSDVAAGRRRG